LLTYHYAVLVDSTGKINVWRIFLLVLFSIEACGGNPHLLELGLALGFGPLRRIT